MTDHGTFHWNELATGDVETARAFYEATLGWHFESMPMPGGTYFVAKLGEKIIGGMMPLSELPRGVPPHWFSYIAVDDVDARVEKAVAAGGTLVRPPFDVPGVGRIAIVKDPTGAALGWMTPVSA